MNRYTCEWHKSCHSIGSASSHILWEDASNSKILRKNSLTWRVSSGNSKYHEPDHTESYIEDRKLQTALPATRLARSSFIYFSVFKMHLKYSIFMHFALSFKQIMAGKVAPVTRHMTPLKSLQTTQNSAGNSAKKLPKSTWTSFFELFFILDDCKSKIFREDSLLKTFRTFPDSVLLL